MAKTKEWIYTKKRQISMAKAQKRHVEIVIAGKRALGYRSSTKRVRVGRKLRDRN